MDIEGLGGETVALLFHEGLIRIYIADLYSLRESSDDLLPLDRMAQKSVDNLLLGVEASKQQAVSKGIVRI